MRKHYKIVLVLAEFSSKKLDSYTHIKDIYLLKYKTKKEALENFKHCKETMQQLIKTG